MHLSGLKAAKSTIDEIRAKGLCIGSIHTLGALHRGHAELIKQSAAENDVTIVTVYPNKIQLFPGHAYEYDLAQDIKTAMAAGADYVVSSDDAEMYPPDYLTYIDQGAAHTKLNSSVFPFASRGQVTGALRWINFVRPHRTYFGMKDIEQAILVKRAVRDLLMDVNVVFVPCVRFGNGVPISSRLMKVEASRLAELGSLYAITDAVRREIKEGLIDGSAVRRRVEIELMVRLKTFEIKYLATVDGNLEDTDLLEPPFVVHACLTDGRVHHFDGLWIRDRCDLENGPPVIWLEEDA